ncbi:hypothetical protein V6N11_069663 [Hibiscus sabdariffa]|uniref:Uncharacterized protein n=1 Tax=Hibiscus sabdariffa TaxID=183260 RepID=A0ABR2Q451_9ROSI
MSVKHKNVVVHREVSKNVAYLESNPPKKSSKKGVTINGAIVVPSMIGLDAAMVEYDLKVASGVRKVDGNCRDGHSHMVYSTDDDESIYDSQWEDMEDADMPTWARRNMHRQDKALLQGHSEFLTQLAKEFRCELAIVLEQEESLWR